jgi:hypothetical protein
MSSMHATEGLDVAYDEPGAGPSVPLVTFVEREVGLEWLKPLRMAAFIALTAEDWPSKWSGGMRVLSLWSPELTVARLVAADVEKHRSYVMHLFQAAAREVPWLLPLLEAAQVTLYVEPGWCSYQLKTSPELHPIPPLLHFADFLPWKTAADDVAH